MIGRGEEYGRRGRDGRRDITRETDAKIRGKDDTPTGAGPEAEMEYGNQGGSSNQGGGGGFRDRSDRNEAGGGRGYRDKGNFGDSRRPQTGFGGGAQVSTVAEGGTIQLLSNHFKFHTQTQHNIIYIYNAELDAFYSRDEKFEAFRSIAKQLKSIFSVYMTYGTKIYSPTRVE